MLWEQADYTEGLRTTRMLSAGLTSKALNGQSRWRSGQGARGSDCLRLDGPDRLSEPGDRFKRIRDFHNELFEALVLQGHDDCPFRMAHVPKHQFAVIVK